MSKLPKIAIVGRPNVGKSALFNCICKERIAIVDEAEGITRDRLYAETELFGRPFQIIDTGGIDARSKAPFNEQIKRQAEIAIEEADSLILVVDAYSGLTDLILEVAKILHRTKKPLCLAVNKIDDHSKTVLAYEFHRLGIPKLIPVSASQGWQIAELIEVALEELPVAENIADDSSIKIAIVGRPNVGKSSLINFLLADERCIVSDISGTTRDSIDISFTHEGERYILIDTAGIRRKSKEHEAVDKFAAIRTKRAIERADLCLLLLDSQEGMTAQDKKIANLIEEEGKGCLILFNKWDLIKGIRMEHYLKGIEEEVPFLKHCPKLFISAKTGRNVPGAFPLVQEVFQNSNLRIATHQLNKFLSSAMQKNHPPMIVGKRLRIYYMAQVDINPPRFVFFVNYPHLMTDTYKKYLYNQFREAYSFIGVPIRMHLKGKNKTRKEQGTKADSRSIAMHDQRQQTVAAGWEFEDCESSQEDKNWENLNFRGCLKSNKRVLQTS